RALGLMQRFFFRASGIAACVKVVLACHELGRIAVGCVLARVLGSLAVPKFCGERVVGAGYGCVLFCVVLCAAGGDRAGEHAGCDQPGARVTSEWSTYHDEFLSSVGPQFAPR